MLIRARKAGWSVPEVTVPAIGDQPPQVINIPDRTGVSPIGTTSPNSGSTGNTNSTYAINAFTSGINYLGTSATDYTLQSTDYQGVIIYNTASAITQTLNSAVQTNFSCSVLNLGAGAMTLTTSDGSAINAGGDSLTLASGAGVQVFFAEGVWWAFTQTSITPVVPETLAAVNGEYVTAYNATTGLFSVNATPGISTTVALAQLTPVTGTQGSAVFVNGLLTAYTPPT